MPVPVTSPCAAPRPTGRRGLSFAAFTFFMSRFGLCAKLGSTSGRAVIQRNWISAAGVSARSVTTLRRAAALKGRGRTTGTHGTHFEIRTFSLTPAGKWAKIGSVPAAHPMFQGFYRRLRPVNRPPWQTRSAFPPNAHRLGAWPPLSGCRPVPAQDAPQPPTGNRISSYAPVAQPYRAVAS